MFACFNIIESFTNGGVVYILNAYGFVNDPLSMKIVMSMLPILCAAGAFTISWFRFRDRVAQQFASANHNPDI